MIRILHVYRPNCIMYGMRDRERYCKVVISRRRHDFLPKTWFFEKEEKNWKLLIT